jgi:hypothetical protein
MTKMKKTTALLVNLSMASTLFWGVPTLEADDLVVRESAQTSAYCHIKFPPMRPETLSWEKPELDQNSGAIIDFYGPCDHDVTGAHEVNIQRRIYRAEHYGDGD